MQESKNNDLSNRMQEYLPYIRIFSNKLLNLLTRDSHFASIKFLRQYGISSVEKLLKEKILSFEKIFSERLRDDIRILEQKNHLLTKRIASNEINFEERL